MFIETINPSTGKPIKQYPIMQDTEVSKIIDDCHLAYLSWKVLPFSERAEQIAVLGKSLLENKSRYAELITQEMGKPIVQSQREIEKCAWLCEHYAKHGAEYLTPRMIESDYSKSFVAYEPMGVVFGIMPWNFPFWQVFRYVIPNLMAGNGCLLKHAPIVTGCGLAIESLFAATGIPKNLFKTLVIQEGQAEIVIEHSHVIGVTLTGSPRAGSHVAAQAGKALKKVVLELGGSDPYIILDDADIEVAAQAIVASRMNNSGQVCIAAKRIIAVKTIVKSLQEAVLSRLKSYEMGDPTQESTLLGPLARVDLRDTVHKQVQQTLSEGASLLTGGYKPEGAGYYYPVTVLDNVTSDMCAFKEEVFGPVVSFITAEGEKNAIELANASPYGLAAAIFSKDKEKAEQLALKEIQAGSVTINHFVSSDPRLPFGGIKASGFGRELSVEGIRSFVNVKTISVK